MLRGPEIVTNAADINMVPPKLPIGNAFMAFTSVGFSVTFPWIAAVGSIIAIIYSLFRINITWWISKPPTSRRTPSGKQNCSRSPFCGYTSYDNHVFFRNATSLPPNLNQFVGKSPPRHDNIKNVPDVVVLCTWMNASHRIVTKYTTYYASMFPSASQLIITSSLSDMTYRSHASQRSRVVPAVDIIQSETEARPDLRILLHIFSDGGANTACEFAEALRSRISRPFPATTIVLDSTPGSGAYKTCRDAIVNSIPPCSLIRAVGIPLTHAYLMFRWIVETFLHAENIRERRRHDLNDTALFSACARRLYLYSKADKIIPWKGVEDHMQHAIQAGLTVKCLRFENTMHVAHIQKYADLYWKSIEDAKG